MTELIWDGKYKDGKKQGPVRIALPFQTIETVNESAQDRRRNLELFASGRDTEWRNRLIWGDKKYVLPSLLPEFAGRINLIYIDPPFDTGADFSFNTEIPNCDESFTKQPSILEQKAYRDTWGRGLESYVSWLYETIVLLHELLSDDGSIYLHLDEHADHYGRIILDEVFGPDSFRNQIAWKSTSAHSDSRRYGSNHQTILFYTKGNSWTWNNPRMDYDPQYVEQYYRYKEANGRRFKSGDLSAYGLQGGGYTYEWHGQSKLWRVPPETMQRLHNEGKIFYTKNGVARLKSYLDETDGMPAQTLWGDKAVQYVVSWGVEKLPYETQKSEGLLQRIIEASSDPGDLVLDSFVGSGTTAAVAEKLNRRWLACDLSRFAIHTTRKRLLGIAGLNPFIVQNLGKYERQAWQVAEFPANGKDHLEEQRQREAAYRKFILDLYHAHPMTGHAWLHGTKAGRMVHVAAVDAPVTQADVKAIARDAWKAVGTSKDSPTKAGVDILGWEFALEVNEVAKQVAAESRVDVSFKKIPREVLDKKAIEQGDVRFFELGALSVGAKAETRDVTLTLTDFVIPTDDIPEEARKAIKHWSQLIDYWAVDWDYKNDTFHNQWQAYRTRKEPKIELQTNYGYKEQGNFQIVVKVIDILGNDTTKTLEVIVK